MQNHIMNQLAKKWVVIVIPSPQTKDSETFSTYLNINRDILVCQSTDGIIYLHSLHITDNLVLVAANSLPACEFF